MHKIINTPGITAENAKATIDASFIVKDHGYTTTIWAKDGITRVYINKARKAMGYVEFRSNRVAASSDTGTSLRNILEVLSGDLVATPTPVKTQSQLARDWDNLQNEGCTDGYNPYRTAQTYSNNREMARHMAAEGGDC